MSSDESKTCPKCDENSMIFDSIGFENSLVCENCGFVKSAMEIVDNVHHGGGGASSANKSSQWHINSKLAGKASHNKTKKPLHIKLEKEIESIGKALNLSGVTIETAQNYLDLCYEKRHYKTKLRSLAVICLHQAMTDNGRAMSLKNVCFQFDVPMKGIFKIQRSFKLLMNEVAPHHKFEQHSSDQRFADDYFLRSTEKFQFCQASTHLLETAKQLHKLFTDLGPTCGLSKDVSVFLAYYFSHLSYEKKIITIRKFTTMNKVKFPSGPQMIAYKECIKVLIELAKKLPWTNNENINEKNYVKYICDVLKSKHVLSHEIRVENENNSNAEDVIFDMGKCEHVGPQLLSENLNEFDIPDDNLIKYIRTKAEITNVVKTKQTATSS